MLKKDLKTEPIYVRVSKREKKAIKDAAKQNNKKMLVYCREKLLENIVIKP